MAQEGGNLNVTNRSVKVEWKIERFFYLPKTVDYQLRSPFFTLSNAEWSLRFYPNGEKKLNSDWISMYLQIENSLSPVAVSFTLGIKRADGSVLKSADHTYKFSMSCEGYGTGKFILKSEFLSMRDVVDKAGTLTLYCEASVSGSDSDLPPPSLTDLQLKIEKYEREVRELNEKLLAANTEKEAAAAKIKSTEQDAKKELQLNNEKYSREVRELNQKLSTAKTEKEAAAANIMNTEEDAKKELQLNIEKYAREVRELNEKLSAANTEKEAAAANMKNTEQVAKKANGQLSENLRELFRSRYEGDTTVRVEDKEFLVHKAILAARSSVFRTMFETDMAEKKDGIVNIEDCEPAHFEDFLLFIYSGQFDIVNPSNALKLCLIADKYNVLQLKEACFEVMAKGMSAESVCDAVYLATLYEKKELLDTAIKYFIGNMGKVILTQKWISFFTEHPIIANELLVKTTTQK